MADDNLPPPIRLVNFVSEDQLEEARKTRGNRLEDGTAQRDRSLYEILKENKDKKDAEFNERFKHRPPKALDEDETEFLDTLEKSKIEYERKMADEEEQQLRYFQAAVASQSRVVHELKEIPSVPVIQDKNSTMGRRNRPSVGMVIKVKRAKTENADLGETGVVTKTNIGRESEEPGKETEGSGSIEVLRSVADNAGLVSYSDESEGDD